jgi:hypothetical protein
MREIEWLCKPGIIDKMRQDEELCSNSLHDTTLPARRQLDDSLETPWISPNFCAGF